MSKKYNDFKLGILFTKEQTWKINEMSQLTGFIDPAKFVQYLVNKEYDMLKKKHGPSWE